MLSKTQIEDRIKAGEIEITYSFFPDEKGIFQRGTELAVNPDDKICPATKLFTESFFGNRLGLRLGPIAMSHNPRYFKQRLNYMRRPGQFDLQSNQGVLIVNPREAISIATNERIRLGANTACIILPRLRNVDAGIIYIPSYIDPYWDGILQAVITNVTDYRLSFLLGERMSVCYFFNMNAPAESEFKESFPHKSHHFGHSWKKLLDEEMNAFPRRKRPLRRSFAEWFRDTLAYFLTHGWAGLSAVGVIGLLVTLLISFGRFQNTMENAQQYGDKLESQQLTIQQLKQDISESEDNLSALEARLPKSGITSLVIPAGKNSITTQINVRRSTSLSNAVFTSIEKLQSDQYVVFGELEPIPSDDSMTSLSLTVDDMGADNSKERKVVVYWIITD